MTSLHTKSDTTLTDTHTHALADATYDACHQYAVSDTDKVWPEITLDDLRGYDGGEYTPQEERTAAYISIHAAE